MLFKVTSAFRKVTDITPNFLKKNNIKRTYPGSR